jgi:ubiquitin-like protein Pup
VISVNDRAQDGREDDSETIERHEKLSDDVDAILDEIDEVLEENAEEFVRSWVLGGGQGWSDFFTPEFYVSAATAGVLGGLAYDEFKATVLRVVKYVREARGGPDYDPFAPNLDSEYYDKSLRNAWKSANRLVKKQGIEHSIDEATALHWTLFIKELEQNTGTVRLGSKRRNRLARAATRADLSPSQLAARIIDQWLKTQG